MVSYSILLILTVVFLAYFCKATTGFGSSLIMMSIGCLLIGPVPALILTTQLDVIGGATLLRIDPTDDDRRLWLPLSVAMVAGVVIGGILLNEIGLKHIQQVVALFLLSVGVWLLLARSKASNGSVQTKLPDRFKLEDGAVCLIAGLCGGLSGLSGAPVLFYFSRKLAKEPLRRILTRIFLAEAMARLLIYLLLGMVHWGTIMTGLLCVPVMSLGLYVGNHAFFKTPEVWYTRFTGVISIGAALRLLFT
jgi:uncharacterized protein